MNKLPLLIFAIITACKVDTTTVKFTTDQVGHIIVPLVINDSVVYGIFDTGSQKSVIEESVRKRINLMITADSSKADFHHIYNDPILLPTTISTCLSMNNMELTAPIKFSVINTKNNINIWGNDIIDQANWLFDFRNNNLIMSQEPITFDMVGAVVIGYRSDHNLKFCSLYYDKYGFLENVLIDTGFAWSKKKSEFYSILLILPDSVKYDRNSNLKKYIQFINKRPDKIDYKFPLVNYVYGMPNYYGNVSYDDMKIFDILSINGIMSLGYAQGYSYMYMDTKNKKIYLKK